MANTVTDTHFSQRERGGRLRTFMARAIKDWGISYGNVKGVVVNEATAACIDSASKAKVFVSHYAFLLVAITVSQKLLVVAKRRVGTAISWR